MNILTKLALTTLTFALILTAQLQADSSRANISCGGCTNNPVLACGGCTNSVSVACGGCTNSTFIACGDGTNSLFLASRE